MASRSYWPIWQITISRLKEFLRSPGAVFWVYGFPIIMMLALGSAFRDSPKEQIEVDVVEDGSQESGVGSRGSEVQETARTFTERLSADGRFKVRNNPGEDWRKRLQAGKTDLVIEIDGNGGARPYRIWDEPHRAESRIARYAVEAALLRAEQPAVKMPEVNHLQQPGSRYIDFLLPGLIGMGLMGGGLWGVGFVVVDMRVRKLLKRFLATPMRKSDFLLAVMCSRLVFTLADIVVILIFGYLVFEVHCQGSYLALSAVIFLGAAAFAGIGLFVASRAQTLETVSGLMNLVMLPMWILSGVFFSSERFPTEIQPLINALPLTALNQALRGVMLEGKSLVTIWPQAAILAGYATVTFAMALRVFRWR
jgi:ABC-2 type transport system permease protein